MPTPFMNTYSSPPTTPAKSAPKATEKPTATHMSVATPMMKNYDMMLLTTFFLLPSPP